MPIDVDRHCSRMGAPTVGIAPLHVEVGLLAVLGAAVGFLRQGVPTLWGVRLEEVDELSLLMLQAYLAVRVAVVVWKGGWKLFELVHLDDVALLGLLCGGAWLFWFGGISITQVTKPLQPLLGKTAAVFFRQLVSGSRAEVAAAVGMVTLVLAMWIAGRLVLAAVLVLCCKFSLRRACPRIGLCNWLLQRQEPEKEKID
jgi:hypothetical protein